MINDSSLAVIQKTILVAATYGSAPTFLKKVLCKKPA